MWEEKGLKLDLWADSLRELQANQNEVKIKEDQKKEDILKDYSSNKKTTPKKKKDKNQKVFFVASLFVWIFLLALLYGLWNMKIINKKIKESVHLLETYKAKNNLIKIVDDNPVFAGSEYATKVKTQDHEVSIYDLLDIENNLLVEKNRIKANYIRYKAPYEYILQYIYLPRLNVWKNPFTEKVNIELFWKNYIDSNPYIDTKLLEKWSKFFVENTYDDSRNDIKTIRVADLEYDEDGKFSIPIDVSVKVDDRRTFLSMLSKLTMTANTKTIMDIDEFTYYLWEALVDNYKKFAVEKTEEYKTNRIWAINYETSFLQSSYYKVDQDWIINVDSLAKFIKLNKKDLSEHNTINFNKKNLTKKDLDYLKEWKLYLFFLRKSLNFSYEDLEDMEAYLKDIENGVEDLTTPAIESKYYPIYMIYLYKDFDSYMEKPKKWETVLEKKKRIEKWLKVKEEEMIAIKNDENPIYKFVGMRFYYWVKNCNLDDGVDWETADDYNYCNNYIRIDSSVIAKAIYTYAYGWRFNDFDGDIVTEDVASKFRQNMKDIPFIQYSLWQYYLTKSEVAILKNPKNPRYDVIKKKKNQYNWLLKKNLHKIYSLIPPLIKIWSFNFAQLKNNSIYGDGYDVNLTMSVYGQWISEDDIVEIQEEIWANCAMDPTKKFTIETAIKRVEKKLEKIYSDDSKNNTEYVYDLKTIKDIFQKYEEEYPKKSKFDKIISLLESYRMLKDRWYCEVEEKVELNKKSE